MNFINPEMTSTNRINQYKNKIKEIVKIRGICKYTVIVHD